MISILVSKYFFLGYTDIRFSWEVGDRIFGARLFGRVGLYRSTQRVPSIVRFVLLCGAIDVIVSSAWGVIVAGYKQCKLVDEALTIRGVDHFIPVIETLSIVRGRHVREHRPLFGDYIITSISSSWKSWLSIRGVAGMLINDLGFPAQIVPAEMERLRRACDGAVFRSATVFEESGFEYGQRVTPKSNDNPFAYHVGRYEGKSKRGDTALFSLFGREQRVEFKNGDLLAV